MTITVRFAPSPTGYLHIGNARTALFNALFAQKQRGAFILRLDDTDVERCREDYARTIIEDMDWLGIEPARLERQSDRLERYDAVVRDLKARGQLYACYETPEELDYKRRRLIARGKPPIYDRAGLTLTSAERATLEAEGRQPHWRFKLDGRVVHWQDHCRGEAVADTASMSDPVLIRANGSYLYTLTSVVDDVDFGVTDVIRGEDHVSNTGVQIELFEALGATSPRWGHHNLLTAASGEGLSKRKGSLSLKSLREQGYEPMSVACLASLVGTAHAVEPRENMAALASDFDLAAVSRAPAKFSPEELDGLNARLLHGLAYEVVAEDLAPLGLADPQGFWLAVRGNLTRRGEAADWARIVSGPVDGVRAGEDAAFLAEASAVLPPEPWDETTWKLWTGALKAATGRKGKTLFMPLRLALTGLDHGPELGALLPLIGHEEAQRRLRG